MKRLKAAAARQQLFADIESWAVGIRTTPLTTDFKLDHWTEGIQVARGGQDYGEHLWFLHRTHYNLYCLATHRKTIEELALGAYAYCSKSVTHTKGFDRRALSDFRRLLRLSKAFLFAEWVRDMIERAVANQDREFFQVLSNAIRKDIMTDTSPSAIGWLLVVLLWFLGGKDYDSRRSFLDDLQQHNIISNDFDEFSFNAELRRLGLTAAP